MCDRNPNPYEPNMNHEFLCLKQTTALVDLLVIIFASCSVFYVFYEQYLTIVNDTWQNLLYCAGKLLLLF